jgi:GTP cyclohydrolase IB
MISLVESESFDARQAERTRPPPELRIDKVGVRGLRFPIQIRDKARSVQNTIATIGMFVDLPQEFKGTHMSRFIEVLNSHGNVVHVENITDILMRCRPS